MYVQRLDLKLPDVGKHYVQKGTNRIVKVVDMFTGGYHLGMVEYYDVSTDFKYYIPTIQFVNQYQPETGMW